MASLFDDLETRLWESADQLWANSSLRPADYSPPVLGLIFLRYADVRFEQAKEEIDEGRSSRRRKVTPDDYQARGVLYLPGAEEMVEFLPEEEDIAEGATSRFSEIMQLPEEANAGKILNQGMKAIEQANENLKGALPKTYTKIENDTLWALMKIFSGIPMDVEGDVFGQIYEYFLGKFAMKEGQKGGEFFTPTSIVKLIVEIIEPFHGRILDPACGSGGMFVQSARFVERHQENPSAEIALYGQEKTVSTVNLCKMNLAVHGLEGDIRQTNTYYEDPHKIKGKFDFVMANPPFNVSGVDKNKLTVGERFPIGLPNPDNANYLWIQLFYSALNKKGRAGFVMANSASDARHSEKEIRKELIEEGVVDIMVSVASKFFYTVSLPCTLWFLDKGKKETDREKKILFIDARKFYRQIDRAHREFKPEQIEFLANIARLYRGEEIEEVEDSEELMEEHFPEGKYRDVPGLCKVATLDEVREHGYSLNPGRYVGIKERVEDEDFDFEERMTELHEELETLNAEAHELEEQIAENVEKILGGEL